MTAHQIIVFPDTNIFLHYRPINEFDWCTILDAETVGIKIAPVVTRELEERKTFHQSGRIRARAATALKMLHSYLLQKPERHVRDGVTLDFLVKEPAPEYAASHGLNVQLADDRLIGTLLVYREENPDRRCVLVTRDLPLTVKAHHYQIEVAAPSDTLLLPPELDETEKKIRQLETELLKYKSREPVLSVQFANYETHATFHVTRAGEADSEIRSMLEIAKKNHPLVITKSSHTSDRSREVSNPLAELIESVQSFGEEFYAEYNTQLNKYYVDYEKYLVANSKFKELSLRSITLALIVVNAGTCPAEDVHVLLHFPNGLTLYDADHLPKPPQEPVAPSKEPNIFPNVSFPYLSDLRVPMPSPVNTFLPKIQKTNSYDVTFEYDKLQHGFLRNFPKLFVQFDSWESASSFSIDYTIHAGNMIADTRGKLGVVIKKT
jgi:PIN domain-containing protein